MLTDHPQTKPTKRPPNHLRRERGIHTLLTLELMYTHSLSVVSPWITHKETTYSDREASALLSLSHTHTHTHTHSGVTVDNIASIAEAGVDMFVAGSAILKAPRTQEAYKEVSNHSKLNP